MPPKRTRAATTRSTRTASAVAPTATLDTAPSARSKASRKTPAAAAAQEDDIEDDSRNDHDSDTLLITNRPGGGRATRRGQRLPEEDYTMKGGLGEGGGGDDVESAPAGKKAVRTKGRVVPKKVQSAGQTQALEALKRRKEEAMRAKTRILDDDEQPPATETERGRRRAPSSPPRTVNRVRRASSSHFAAAPPSAVKAQGTPSVDNTSVLALTKFKRRPRQPSLLRMMQQSDVENDDDTLDDSNATLDYSLGDFEPDHESTPLNLNRNAARGTAAAAAAAAAPSSEPRTSSSRKRKLAEREMGEVSVLQVPRSSPPGMEEEPAAAPVPRETSSEHLYSEASDLPNVIADTQPEPAENEEEDEAAGRDAAAPAVRSETMASSRPTSPLSSAVTVEVPDEEEAPAKRPRRALRNTKAAKARATQQANDNDDHAADPLSSSDSDSDTAVETPVRPAGRGGTRRKATTAATGGRRKAKAMGLSTATLQALLPRRRKMQTRGDAFDIPSEDEDEDEGDEDVEEEDEDELHRAPAPTRRGAKARTADSTVRGKKAGKTVAVVGGKKRLSRTYGRRLSDKENQQEGESYGEGEEEVEEVEARNKSKELSAAARKFAEIDEWEMEFESVDMGGASASSPWR